MIPDRYFFFFTLHTKDTLASSDLLKESRIEYWPNIYFPAYHPDLVYAKSGEELAEISALLEYNSSLVLYAWMSSLSPAQAIKLFCDPVYEKLGFYAYWDEARPWLIEAFQQVGLAFRPDMDRLAASGCFMHSTNHPKLRLLAVVARLLVEKMGLTPATRNPHEFIHDNLADASVWPVYPEIGQRLGIDGEYAFKQSVEAAPDQKISILSLEEFVEQSYQAYENQARKGEVFCDRLRSQAERYRGIEALIGRSSPSRARNPYSGLPDHCFWRRGVENVPSAEVDPVVSAKFKLSPQDRIATAGSCFAQHIARTLVAEGYGYFVAEQAPAGTTPDDAAKRGYGMFSARYGNVYTMRQMVQLIDRAYGRFLPADGAWRRADGRYVDPFRPQIEPDGFATPDEVVAARDGHFASVRRMLEDASVFIFTLGLTEAWRARADGAVFPLAPGVAAGEPDLDRYEFVNFGTAEVEADVEAFIERHTIGQSGRSADLHGVAGAPGRHLRAAACSGLDDL